MKIQIDKNKKKCGSAMIGVMILALVVGGAMAAYLLLVSGENTFVARSQSWNSAIIIAESGLEEGLACANKNAGVPGNLFNWTNTPDGWDTGSGTNTQSTYKAKTWVDKGVTRTWAATTGTIYHVQRILDSTNGYYDVYINNSLTSTNSGPEILSIGTATWNTTSSSDNTYASVQIKAPVQRKIYLSTTAVGSGGGSMVAITTIDFKGNNVTIDSFNSTNPAYCQYFTNLGYGVYTSTKRHDQAIVATDGNTISMGNANVYGYIDTAPGGSPSIGSQGTVGDLTWVGADPSHPDNTGIQSGHTRSDMNVTFPDVVTIVTNYSTIPSISTNIGGVNYSLLITNKPGGGTNYYGINAIGSSLYIYASNVVIYATNGISIGGGGGKTISVDTNGSAVIYSGNITTGNGTINNNSQSAGKLTILGTTLCTSITMSGNSAGTAFIYAPEASLTLSGSGSSTYDLCGAIVVHDITLNGHYNFHYDEMLGQNSSTTSFIASGWKEVQ